MKHHLYAFLFLFTTAHYVHGQSYIILAHEPKAGHWKYYNIKGEVLIDKKYPLYYKFSAEGFALVGNEIFKVINRKGEEIKTDIDVAIYDDHNQFKAFYSDGLVVTRHHQKFGCIDTLGKIAVPHVYNMLTEFQCDHAIGRIKRTTFVVDKTGRQVKVADSTITDAKPFYENLAAFVTKAGVWGFIDVQGNVAIAPQYKGVGNFSGGLAWARNENGLIGYIDPKGNWIIEPAFNNAGQFDIVSGLARVKCNGCPRTIDTNDQVWSYIDTKGQVQHQFNVTKGVEDFSEGLARYYGDGLTGYLNNKGEWAIKPQFEAVRDFENDYAWVKKGLWGLIDKQGNWVIEPRFDAVKEISRINK